MENPLIGQPRSSGSNLTRVKEKEGAKKRKKANARGGGGSSHNERWGSTFPDQRLAGTIEKN